MRQPSTTLTLFQIWPLATPFIKTYRLPTPLLIYQLALIPGSLLTGFLLSPLLYLSRQVARRPVRRLRFPEEKQKQRRLLALAFYGGSFVIVVGVIGMWTRWCLRNRDPWLWVVFWLLEGRKKWTRPLLLAYWAVLGSISVAGWNRQLARSRRHRHRVALSVMSDSTVVPYMSVDASRPTTSSSANEVGDASAPPIPTPEPTIALSLNFANLPNLPNLPHLGNGAGVATDLLDAADKRVPTLSVNARQYVRYFALYPFGAAVHLFMYEFLDSKDSGTAILSHFYLLTGCANSVWFEG
ncbi:hypothetical protein EIP86_007126 [Pleurotus ostreatoroseus]|nr:hypothetical protein EIP86_007126 [Pleurotus ostreatoroseus]